MQDQLAQTDSEDIDFVLERLEDSLDIRFVENELAGVVSLNDLIAIVMQKLEQEEQNTCTSLKAFYLLKKAIQQPEIPIKPNTKLEDLFPKKNRKAAIKQVGRNLGMDLHILQPKDYIVKILLVSFLLSCVGLFVSKYAFVFLVLTSIGFVIAYKTGIEFAEETVGDLAKKITRENYMAIRKNTVNKKEIRQLVLDLFSKELQIEVTGDSKF
ncbi:MAG: hypothetical protein AAF518_07160 [Spirochaetota bacterium]